MDFKNILRRAKQSYAKAPAGDIRVTSSNNCYQFHDGNKYIPKKQEEYIRKLAQKKYDKKIIEVLEEQVALLENFHAQYEPNCVQNVYDNLHKELQKLVTPYDISNEEYARKWSEAKYISKEQDGIFITAKGERVRSKSETLIADRLFYAGIPYRYEAKLDLICHGMYKTFYPDFTVLNKNTRQEFIIEHLGMMDSPEYATSNVEKMDIYAENGYFQGKNILFTFETSKYPLNTKRINDLINQFFLKEVTQADSLYV